MRICIVSRYYPPYSTDGIPRQRHALAHFLSEIGHDVNVVTIGRSYLEKTEAGVKVFELPPPKRNNDYSVKHGYLDEWLTYSQLLFEGVEHVDRGSPVDIVDVPLWLAEGLVTTLSFPGPVVIFLQTTLLQIIELEGRPPWRWETGLARLEKESLRRAAALIADSKTVLNEVGRLYGPDAHKKPSRIIPFSIPPLPVDPEDLLSRPQREMVEVLIVGRLERRKGTPLAFEVIPEVLRECPNLCFRFVGRDNSEGDGFRRETGLSYPEYFASRHPHLKERVIFEGQIPDECLTERYLSADLLLSPSLFESFGFVFLEAARAGLPVVAFEVGGAKEIFYLGEDHGAVLIPPRQSRALSDAVVALANDDKKRTVLGARAFERFQSEYTGNIMATRTIEFYEEVVSGFRTRRSPRRAKIFHVMEALDYGDAVSNIARKNTPILAELGAERPIISLFCNPLVAKETVPITRTAIRDSDAIYFHFWGFSRLERFICNHIGRKGVHYHNITPPYYFSPWSPAFEMTSRGYDQLGRIADCFDLILGDSEYNLDEYSKYLSGPKPTLCVYPIIEAEAKALAAYDEKLFKHLREDGTVNVLFVGRVARNKRQDRIMEAFDLYCSEINPNSRLFIVGDFEHNPDYFQELREYHSELKSKDRVVFTGKVTDEEIQAYYRAADIFMCASQHEGFCMPIIEAMCHDIPVLASAAAAVPETMGSSGILIDRWDAHLVAQTLEVILKDKVQMRELLLEQRKNLLRFSEAECRKRLGAVVRFLRDGEDSELFARRGPKCNQ